jgi:hypothetical protein
MESIYSSPDNQSRTSAGAAPQRWHLGPPASNAEVMREQIEYLLDHLGAACPPGCPDCVRLEEVQHCLLRPFC